MCGAVMAADLSDKIPICEWEIVSVSQAGLSVYSSIYENPAENSEDLSCEDAEDCCCRIDNVHNRGAAERDNEFNPLVGLVEVFLRVYVVFPTAGFRF